MHKTLTGLVAVAALAVPASALADQSFDCGSGRSLTLQGANTLWPPNHKYHDYTVSAIGNALDQNVDLSSTVTSNEPDVGLGSGGPQHAMDANPFTAAASNNSGGDVSVFQQLRAERSGRGTGRTYTFHVSATWDFMTQSCSTTFSVFVPHDQRA